jgi:hypothetical protein
VTAADKSGVITSAAPDGAGAVALALLPLDRDGNVPGDGTVVAGGVAGRVLRRVGADVPQPGVHSGV